MEIVFEKMLVEGFGPILSEEFDWNLPGINIIKANNGYGKTKFTNALVWVLYGKPLSGSVETWESIRPKGYKGTKVELDFKINGFPYKVVRCKGYKGKVEGAAGKNRLLVYEDGELLDFGGKSDDQKELENILGYSLNLFKNSIIFGQKLKRLVNESGPNKKAVLDEAFEVAYIAKANKAVLESNKEISEKLTRLNSEKEILEIKIESLNTAIERDKELEENFEIHKTEEIAIQNDKIVKLRIDKSNYQKAIKELEPDERVLILAKGVLKKKKKLYDSQTTGGDSPILRSYKLSTELANSEKDGLKLIKEIDKLKEAIKIPLGKCSTCGKPYTKEEEDLHLEHLNEELRKLNKKYQTIINNIGKYKKDIIENDINVASLNKLSKKIKSITKKVETLEKNLKSLPLKRQALERIKKDIEECRANKQKIKAKTFQKNYDNLQRDLSDKNVELENLTKELELVKTAYEDNVWLIKEPLSNSGLKAYIFNMMLESVNKRLIYYSKFSGMDVEFTIDMESAKKDLLTLIATKTGEYVQYEELSGGQQQKVDIVTVFAIHDVISDNKSCNLLIMDEVFESLDDDNIELLTELIQDKAIGKCLYLITHRYSFSPTNSNTIELDYVNGITSIV